MLALKRVPFPITGLLISQIGQTTSSSCDAEPAALICLAFPALMGRALCAQRMAAQGGQPYMLQPRSRTAQSAMTMQAAAQRMVEFWLGTFADPIYLGDWPESVKARIPYIPKINPELVILNFVGLMYTLAV